VTDNSAGLRNFLSSRLSHRELRSSLRESHSFLSLPTFIHHSHAQEDTQNWLKKIDKPDGEPVLCQRRFSSVFRAVFYIVKLHSLTYSVWGPQGQHLVRSAPFCDIPRCRWVVSYRRFGIMYRSNLQGSSWTARPLKMGPIGLPETPVKNYQFELRKIPEYRRSHLQCSGSLQSRHLDYSYFVRIKYSR
jgi:hypothetical protein